jgi:GT2 family glycosyltransferase
MTSPAVSVIMAAFNGADHISETIASVLGQSFADFELIVVDDCSTDNTRQVLSGFADARLRVLSTRENSGPVAARNLAAAAARGRYLAGLDQDDVCLPARFARQVAYLDAHPDVVVLGTATQRMAGGRLLADRLGRRTTPGFLRWMLHVSNPLVWSSVMLRMSAVERLAVFERVERQFAEDFDLYHRLAAAGDVARLDEVLMIYRQHAGGASQTRAAQMQASAAGVLEESYRPWFGQGAARAAALVSRHVAAREPVPDVAVFQELRGVFRTLRRAFTEAYRPDAATRGLMTRQTVRILGGVGLASVKGRRKSLLF